MAEAFCKVNYQAKAEKWREAHDPEGHGEHSIERRLMVLGQPFGRH